MISGAKFKLGLFASLRAQIVCSISFPTRMVKRQVRGPTIEGVKGGGHVMRVLIDTRGYLAP